MKNKDVMKQLVAGIFFIACIVLTVGAVFVLGMDRGLTEKKFEMNILFTRVEGLAIGAPVRLSGVNVGTVKDIGFLDQEVKGRAVKVTLNLLKRYEKQIRKGIKFSIITEGVLGQKIVEITTQPTYQRQKLDDYVIGEDPLDLQDLAETFGATAEVLLETSKTFDSITKELKSTVTSTRRLLNRIEQRIIDGTLFKVF